MFGLRILLQLYCNAILQVPFQSLMSLAAVGLTLTRLPMTLAPPLQMKTRPQTRESSAYKIY